MPEHAALLTDQADCMRSVVMLRCRHCKSKMLRTDKAGLMLRACQEEACLRQGRLNDSATDLALAQALWGWGAPLSNACEPSLQAAH